MRVYIAAPYPLRDMAQALMRRVEGAGHTVTSTWLTSYDRMTNEFACLDLADVRRADVLLALSPSEWLDKGTGGRHVEFGYALALNKPIVLIGERGNIFHYLSDVLVIHDDALESTLRELESSRPAASAPDRAFSDVAAEFWRAEGKHKPFNSSHEGYAVIQEEVDELWADVKADRKEAALVEAVQVAAMGLRYVVNLTPSA